jgi:L,D-transpeptidase ErfK/SrfK
MNKQRHVRLTATLMFCAAWVSAQVPIASKLSGGDISYQVLKDDSLTLIGARFGVDAGSLALANGLSGTARLRIGQVLQVNNRHLLPSSLENGIVINVPQRMGFFFKNGDLVASFPVAIGRAKWPTEVGQFSVLEKQENKTWLVPKSIREEMEKEGKPPEERVPPGPDNPLGKYWIRISPTCGIHSTISPTSVYSPSTHGCLRLQSEAITDLYPSVQLGTPVNVIYEPVLLGKVGERIYLEVHADIYKRKGPAFAAVQELAASAQLTDSVDWPLVNEVIRRKEGIARKISPNQ